jgi:hypothetical protein
MTRCNQCNSVVTRTDTECYICGEVVPGTKRPFWRRNTESRTKAAAPVTPVSNLLFIGSLVLTGVCFLSDQKMPLPVSAALSGILLAARIVTDRRAKRVAAR